MRRARSLLVCLVVLSSLGAHAATIPQDDAGSGQDAPNEPTASFVIEPGSYAGTIGGIAIDADDWYAFEGSSGDQVHVRVAGGLGCIELFDASSSELAGTCTAATLELVGIGATLPDDGTYYLHYYYIGNPDPYWFSFAINGTAEPPTAWSAALGGTTGGLPRVGAASQNDEHVVIAMVDTGVNPYHAFFRAPGLTDHPSTWLSGFPADAASVPLTLDAANLPVALQDDAEEWSNVQRTTYNQATDTFDTHLYTFPGTRVIGGVSFSEYNQPADVEPIPVFDHYGHGTHSAGLAGGANLPAPEGNVLIVMVEAGAGHFATAARWAARQPWIDAISLSIGVRANAPVTFNPIGLRDGLEWATLEAAQSGKPVFIASGNGFSGSGVTPDHCSTHTSPYTGPQWVTRIGAAEPASGNPTWWHCLPVDAIGRTDVSSPSYDSLTASSTATGTSAATPNVAGHFARLLLQARRDARALDRTQVRDHLLRAAQPAEPTPAVGAEPSIDPLSTYDQGYGLVDAATLERAMETVASGAPTPRPELDDWWAQDAEIRSLFWDAEDGLLMVSRV